MPRRKGLLEKDHQADKNRKWAVSGGIGERCGKQTLL